MAAAVTLERLPTRAEHRAMRKARPEAVPSVRPTGVIAGKARGRVVPDLSLWAQSFRLGGKLTPLQVSAIIRAADHGYPRLLMDLANECRQKDAHLAAVLSVAEEAIAGLEWQLKLPDNARAKDKRARDWVEKVLRATPGLRKLIAYLAGARYYGYDVNEIVWRKDAGKLIPDDFVHLQHRRFGFDPISGKFVLRDIGMPPQGEDIFGEYAHKFVRSHPRANGDAPQREGLARLLVWMVQFRTWSFSDYLRTAEMSWKPWRIGTYKKGVASEADEAALEMILEKLTTTGWAAKPDSMDIAIEWPANSTSAKPTHAELLNILANEMSKAVLGQTETVQSSNSSGYAQAKVHDEIRHDIRDSSARQVAADLTRDLVTPLIALNFKDVAVPAFEFVTSEPPDLMNFATAVQALANSSLVIPQKWVRDQVGIPEPVLGELTIGGQLEDPDAEDDDADAGGDDDPKDPNEPDEPKEPNDGKPAADGPKGPTEPGASEDDKPDAKAPKGKPKKQR